MKVQGNSFFFGLPSPSLYEAKPNLLGKEI
jgi:hypothetical protein